MKVSNIKDIEKFFEVVDSCQGKVELVTGDVTGSCPHYPYKGIITRGYFMPPGQIAL